VFRPVDSVALHTKFVTNLLDWFDEDLGGSRVVISHTAPVINPNTNYGGDMIEVIEKHQPALWIYGHTHECDDQMLGKTRIISNQLGYPDGRGRFECKDFDSAALRST
jgi:Icc-related predicted phosphoesterase